eukprot:scaffold32195_cov65-Phaeocystis_antarctica.AAC.7
MTRGGRSKYAAKECHCGRDEEGAHASATPTPPPHASTPRLQPPAPWYRRVRLRDADPRAARRARVAAAAGRHRRRLARALRPQAAERGAACSPCSPAPSPACSPTPQGCGPALTLTSPSLSPRPQVRVAEKTPLQLLHFLERMVGTEPLRTAAAEELKVCLAATHVVYLVWLSSEEGREGGREGRRGVCEELSPCARLVAGGGRGAALAAAGGGRAAGAARRAGEAAALHGELRGA